MGPFVIVIASVCKRLLGDCLLFWDELIKEINDVARCSMKGNCRARKGDTDNYNDTSVGTFTCRSRSQGEDYARGVYVT